MSGMDAFTKIFGDITILDLLWFIVAVAFVITVSIQALRFLHKGMKNYDRKEEEWTKTVEATKHYPEYREQSKKIQEEINNRIDNTIKLYNLLKTQVDMMQNHIQEIEEQNKIRERNKLCDLLLQYYKNYGLKDRNPSMSWTLVESQTFWALFKDYEDLGGDGLMHSTVEPAMKLLNIVNE